MKHNVNHLSSLSAVALACFGFHAKASINTADNSVVLNRTSSGFHGQHSPLRPLSRHELDAIVSAIYRTEGSSKTKHPYGVLGHGHLTNQQARLMCEATVAHAWRDSLSQKVDKKFINFLADRYCPRSVDPLGNTRWKRNMICMVLNKNHT